MKTIELPKEARGFSYYMTNNSIKVKGSLCIENKLANFFTNKSKEQLEEDIYIIQKGNNHYLICEREYKFANIKSIESIFLDVNRALYQTRTTLAECAKDEMFKLYQQEYMNKYFSEI